MIALAPIVRPDAASEIGKETLPYRRVEEARGVMSAAAWRRAAMFTLTDTLSVVRLVPGGAPPDD
jgi:hypothetical protein